MKAHAHIFALVFVCVAFACVGYLPARAAADHAININSADAASLTTLTGIGEVKAQAIVDYRTQNGPFAAIEDIQNVSGIGTATYNGIKDHITVAGTSGSTSNTNTSNPSSTSSSSTSATTEETTVSSYVPPPVPQLFADAGGDRTVIVGADTVYKGTAYTRESEPVTSLVRYSWNFGDGTTAEGASVAHHFNYPGRYAVVLNIAEHMNAASDRIIVRAEAPQLSFTVHPDASVSVGNLSGRDLDLSAWLIRSFARDFVLPDGTLVLAGETLRIAQGTLGFFATSVDTTLRYPNGVVVPLQEAAAPAHAGPPRESASVPAAPAATIHTSAPAIREQEQDAEESAPLVRVQTAAAAESFPRGSGHAAAKSRWWFGALALAALASGAAVAVRRLQRKEWDIIEES
jgi:comEA protein